MSGKRLRKGDIVAPVEDGELVGIAIYLDRIEMNGKITHVVLDTVLLSGEGKMIYNVAEYDKVMFLGTNTAEIIYNHEEEVSE